MVLGVLSQSSFQGKGVLSICPRRKLQFYRTHCHDLRRLGRMGVLEERSDGGKGILHVIGCVLYKHMETYQTGQGAPLLFFKYRAMTDNFKKKKHYLRLHSLRLHLAPELDSPLVPTVPLPPHGCSDANRHTLGWPSCASRLQSNAESYSFSHNILVCSGSQSTLARNSQWSETSPPPSSFCKNGVCVCVWWEGRVQERNKRGTAVTMCFSVLPKISVKCH